MSIEIKVPAMGESVTEATIARWLKKEGDAVKRDEPLVELETDKVTVEVPSPAAGVLEHIEVKAGGTVQVGAVLGAVKEGAAAPQRRSESRAAKPEAKPAGRNPRKRQPPRQLLRRSAAAAVGAAHRGREQSRRVAIAGTGKRGQVTKGDVLAALEAVKAACPRRSRRRRRRARGRAPSAKSACRCRACARPSRCA